MDVEDSPIPVAPPKVPRKPDTACAASPQRMPLAAGIAAGGMMLLAGVYWRYASGGGVSVGLVLLMACSASGLIWMWRDREIRCLRERLAQLQADGWRAGENYAAVTERLEREIADHRCTLDQLRASERNYRNVFENTGTATIILDHDLTITRMNAEFAELCGAPRQEVERRLRLPDFVSTKDVDSLQSYFDARLNGLSLPPEIEFSLTDRQGAAKQVVVQVGSIPGTQNFVASLSDITDIIEAEKERRNLAAQLNHAQRMEAIGTLAGGIAHDFNNLMMGMLGNLSLVTAELGRNHSGLPKLKNIEALIQSGAKLTGQLLGYARKGHYEVSLTDLNDVIQTTCETIGRTMKGIAFEMDLSPDIEAVLADAGQMEQVLVNLMVNAADAMPSGGSLYLTSDLVTHRDIVAKKFTPKPGRYVRITVQDTGVGMDGRVLNRIFDPFFTTKDMGRGTGLGLASVYGIIKGHGGYIEAASTVGEGSTFTIHLPAAGPLPTAEASPNSRCAEGSEVLLVVDDEPMVLEVTTAMLNAAGYQAMSAANGSEALDIYREHGEDIDLVIMDMVMPGLSGEALFEAFCEIDPAVNVLVSSGYAMDRNSEKLLQQGARGFIQKPFSIDTLGQRIRDIIDSCRITA